MLPLLVLVAFLTGTAGIFFDISGFAYVPSLVTDRDLVAANRAVQGSSTVAEMAGPGLAGLLVQAVEPALALFGNPDLRALTVHAAAYNLAEQVVVINPWADLDLTALPALAAAGIAYRGVPDPGLHPDRRRHGGRPSAPVCPRY